MSVGNNNLAVDLTTAFGPDNQPYFGGQQTVNTFNSTPGGSAPTAWLQCIFNGFGFANPAPTTLMGKLQAVFNAHSANHCGNAQPNSGFLAAAIVQPQALISHGSYMCAPTTVGPIGTTGGMVVQFKVTADPSPECRNIGSAATSLLSRGSALPMILGCCWSSPKRRP